MENQIVCPNCKKVVPVTEAIAHQLREKIQSEFAKKEADLKKQGEAELEKVRFAARKWQEEQTRKWAELQKQQEKELEQKLKQKVQAEMETKLKDTQNESEELKAQLNKRREEELEMRKQLREMKQRDEEREIEMAKKLHAEQERIRQEAAKRADEEHHLKELELQKKLNDVLKANEDLKRRIEQGSQQAQGEVLELDIEQKLRQEFPHDQIKEVPKGIRGADLIQIVMNRQGEACGTIVWELKRTKSWSNEFIPKLKDDQRQLKAEIAVIISDALPNDISVFGLKEGVWVGNYQIIVNLAYILRRSLLEVAAVKSSSVGRKEKMEELWEYLTSVGFKQRMEVIIETFTAMQHEIETERRWFNSKWEKREKTLRKVIDSTAGMYGGLQQIMGKSLPTVRDLEVEDEEIEEVEVEIAVERPMQIDAAIEDDANTLF